jgi:hypothetical protein
MKRFLGLSALVLLLGNSVYGQVTNCTQVLRLAQSTYEQGRLHELPGLLKNCLSTSEDNSGFTKQQRVDAYRYLTLAYIYLEEPKKADSTMLLLLNTDHYFEINANVDPAEFVALYNTFRTKPVFSIGIKGGLNNTSPIVTKNYYEGNAAAGQGKYGSKIGFQVGFVFEKHLFDRSRSKFLSGLTFAPELLYTLRSISVSQPKVFSSDSTGKSVATGTGIPKQGWLDFNPIFQYQLKQSTLNPYIGFGPGVSYLLNGPATLTLVRNNSVGTVSGPDVVMKTSYQKIVPSLIATAGVKYQFGSIKLTAEVRVQYGLTSVVNPSTRTNSQAASDDAFVLNDFKQFNAMVNVGFIYPYFNPIKKSHKK